MPFNTTDNLTTWAYTDITEFYEGLGSEEDDVQQKERIRGYITADAIDDLKDYVSEQIAAILRYDNQSLQQAMVNSIDWSDLRLKLKKWEYDLEDDE